MVSLNSNPKKRYYSVKNNIVFNISTANSTDSCVVEIGDDTNLDYLPTLKVTKTDGTSPVYYYMDALISDGDYFNKEKTSGDTANYFMKTRHSSVESSDEFESFKEYYNNLAWIDFRKACLKYYDKDAEWFNKNLNKLGIPAYMFFNNGYSLFYRDKSGTDFSSAADIQIRITQEMLDFNKLLAIMQLATDSANSAIEKYNYMVDAGTSSGLISVKKF